MTNSGSLFESAQSKKRNTFFSFHYADIMRVNVVRKSGEFKTEDKSSGRNIEGFYDYSLWESKKRTSEESLKTMIRDGVDRTSAVCVLIGTETFKRRWVRYEIARSVTDGRGLLSIHINSIKHHEPPYQPHKRGFNPCSCLGIYKANGSYFLAEQNYKNDRWIWEKYSDYVSSVSIPRYMKSPPTSTDVITLSSCTLEYNWESNGHGNIGSRIDTAAADAGK